MKDKDLIPLMITRLASQILVAIMLIVAMTNLVDTLEGLDEINPLYADVHNYVVDPKYTGCIVIAVLAMCAIEFIYQSLVIDLLDAEEMLA